MASVVAAPEWYTPCGQLRVHPTLVAVVEEEVCPGTGFSPAYFWHCLEMVVAELRPEVERCLRRRDVLQGHIDAFYERSRAAGADPVKPEFRPQCQAFLREIGYLEEDRGP